VIALPFIRTPAGGRSWLFRLCALLCVFSGTVRAHDPYECWTSALVRAEVLELTVTMAQATALRFVDPDSKIRALTSQNFEQVLPKFEKAAAGMCVITSNRKALVSRRVTVELTDENDVVFKVFYPRPPPGPLHFHAAFLKKLGEGYGGILEASDTSGNHLGWEQLSFDNPNYEVTVLPVGQGPARKS
jgi:hypothetical protein